MGSVLQVENDKCSILKNQLSCYNCGSLGSVLAGIYVTAVINKQIITTLHMCILANVCP